MRYICFDTETTGLSHKDGDRVFDVGCVEIIDRIITGNEIQFYCNPCKSLSPASKAICCIEDDFLKDKKIFKEKAQDFLDFLFYDHNGNKNKAILLAHNAKFDVDFINNELLISGFEKVLDDFTVIDTIKIAKKKFPGTITNLDFLCKKFNIDTDERKKLGHGSLLDSHLLANVFLSMCENDNDDYIMNIGNDDVTFFGFAKREFLLNDRNIGKASNVEKEIHESFLKKCFEMKF